MAVVYCTAQDVATFCNLTDYKGDRAVFGSNITIPTQDEVEDLIEVAQELIEKKCNNAWDTRYISVSDELHDFYYDWQEMSIHLNNQNILTLTTPTDKLEVWNGNNWEDWLTLYTEGRGDDFFVDYQLGIIYFLSHRPPRGIARIRVTYRYSGGAPVPQPIRLATALQVGILLSNSEYATIMFPEGESGESVQDRITRWENQIDKFTEKYVISEIPVNLAFTPIRQ